MAVVVSVQRRDTLSQLGPNTKFVHISERAPLWLIKRILVLAPGVQVIEVAPLHENKIGDRHRQICAEQGVQLAVGYVRGAAVWKEGKKPHKSDYRSLRDVVTEQRRVLARQLGLAKLPEHLPLARLQTFEAIIKASRDGRLLNLQQQFPNQHRALTLRFGLEGNLYRTLQEVANQMGGVTRERVRQHEKKALRLLGIQEDV